MAVHDIWLYNLKALVESEGNGDRRKGMRAVADLANLSEEYIYQLIEGKPKKDGEPRQVGKVAARKIALAFANGRPESWFDSMDGGISGAPQLPGAASGQQPYALSIEGSAQPQINERRAVYRVVSVESAVEGIATHLNSVQGYDKPTVISLLTTLVNSPDMHAIVAAGLRSLKPQARDDPEKQSSPAQKAG
ncbi:MAG: hypothetical protein V4706_01810 [Pseudomonadota bacterium]